MNVTELREARANGLRPSAPGAGLRGADLSGANLTDAGLRGSDLTGANLTDAVLTGADLRGADLTDADLTGSDLRYAVLRGADLTGANLTDADLRGANLTAYADLRSVGIVALGETPSGWACIFPTPEGWVMQVGCWRGSPDELRALVAQNEGWPEARGAEVARRRPYLELVLAHADLVMAEHPTLIAVLAEKWSNR